MSPDDPPRPARSPKDRRGGALAGLLALLGVPRVMFAAIMAFAFAVPALFVGLGGWLIIEAAVHARGAFPVVATVVHFEVEPDDEGGSPHLRPVLAFNIAGADRQQWPLNVAQTGWSLEIGDTVEALWNPDHPETVRLPGFWRHYGDGAVMAALGLAAIVAFALRLWRLRSAPWLRPGPGGFPHDVAARRRRRD